MRVVSIQRVLGTDDIRKGISILVVAVSCIVAIPVAFVLIFQNKDDERSSPKIFHDQFPPVPETGSPVLHKQQEFVWQDPSLSSSSDDDNLEPEKPVSTSRPVAQSSSRPSCSRGTSSTRSSSYTYDWPRPSSSSYHSGVTSNPHRPSGASNPHRPSGASNPYRPGNSASTPLSSPTSHYSSSQGVNRPSTPPNPASNMPLPTGSTTNTRTTTISSNSYNGGRTRFPPVPSYDANTKGLTKEQIAKCVKVADASTILPEDSCTICLDDFEGKIAHQLPCNHNFHFDCISNWLKGAITCPNCRREYPNGNALPGMQVTPPSTPSTPGPAPTGSSTHTPSTPTGPQTPSSDTPTGPSSDNNTWGPVSSTTSVRTRLVRLLPTHGLSAANISQVLQNYGPSDVPSHQVIHLIFTALDDSQKEAFSHGFAQLAMDCDNMLTPEKASEMQSSLMYCNYLKTMMIDMKETFAKLSGTVTSLTEFADFRSSIENAVVFQNLLKALYTQKIDPSIMKPVLMTLGNVFFFKSVADGSDNNLTLFEKLVEVYSLKMAQDQLVARMGAKPNMRDQTSLGSYTAECLAKGIDKQSIRSFLENSIKLLDAETLCQAEGISLPSSEIIDRSVVEQELQNL